MPIHQIKQRLRQYKVNVPSSKSLLPKGILKIRRVIKKWAYMCMLPYLF